MVPSLYGEHMESVQEPVEDGSGPELVSGEQPRPQRWLTSRKNSEAARLIRVPSELLRVNRLDQLTV